MGLLSWLRRGSSRAPVVLSPDDPTLVVLVEAFDAARADSAVLTEAEQRGVDLAQPLLLRHHLVRLPDDDAVARAADLVGQDGYAVSAPERRPDGLCVRVTRTQVVTALSASQERSRMAGLAQRLGGDVEGWDALGPGPRDG